MPAYLLQGTQPHTSSRPGLQQRVGRIDAGPRPMRSAICGEPYRLTFPLHRAIPARRAGLRSESSSRVRAARPARLEVSRRPSDFRRSIALNGAAICPFRRGFRCACGSAHPTTSPPTTALHTSPTLFGRRAGPPCAFATLTPDASRHVLRRAAPAHHRPPAVPAPARARAARHWNAFLPLRDSAHRRR